MDTTPPTPPEPPEPPQAPPPPPASPPASPPPEPPSSTPAPQQPAGGEPDLKAYLSKAWELVIGEPALLIVGYAVITIAILLSSIVVVGPLLLAGPLIVGFFQVVQKRLNGEAAEFGDLFAAFQDFARTMIAGLLVLGAHIAGTIVNVVANLVLTSIPCIGTIIGFVLGIAIAIAVGAATFFVLQIIAFTNTDPVEAFMQSFNFAMANMKEVVLLSVVCNVLFFVGCLACGIGIFLTGPIAFVVMVIAYNQYFLPKAHEVH